MDKNKSVKMRSWKKILKNTIIELAIVIIILTIAITYFKSYSIDVKSILLNANNIYPYTFARFKIYINNTGSTYIKNMSVDIYFNNAINKSYLVSLAPEQGTILNISYEIPSSGKFAMMAVADPNKLLNIVNRSQASNTISFFAKAAEPPNIYSSIPNNNIILTRRFNFQQEGIGPVLYLSNIYNLSIADSFDLNSNHNLFNFFGSLLNYINSMNGAYVKYANSTSMYVLFVKGIINTTDISIRLQRINLTTNYTKNIMITKLNSTTSLCEAYQSGWTKIIIINNKTDSNCTSIISSSYQPTENNTITNTLINNTELLSLQSRLEYANSINAGSFVLFTNNSIGLVNILANNYGYFFGDIQKSAQLASNIIKPCNGIVYNSTNTIICFATIQEIQNLPNYNLTLINSTEIKNNYQITIYLLVKKEFALNAEYDSINIIKSLNISGLPQRFKSTIFKNSCNISNSTLACSIIKVGSNSNILFAIKNLNKSPIHLNSISCYLSGFEKNQSINSIIAGNQSINESVQCMGGNVSFSNPSITYNLAINYTLNNVTRLSNGTAVVTFP